FTVKYDISGLAVTGAGNGYLCHFEFDGAGGDMFHESAMEPIICNGKAYEYKNHQFDGWSRYILEVVDAPATEETPEA
ncbi:MAG: hypothetical protein K2K12_01900, partial [Clostridia bacterium]|nr:hypothetical protein [Clostridia bacterium]